MKNTKKVLCVNRFFSFLFFLFVSFLFFFYLHSLHESLKEPQGVSSVISQLFGGQLVSRTRCSRCGHVSSARERFLDLSLSIAFESSSAQTNNNNNSNHSLDTQSDDTSQRLVQPSSIMDVVDEENSSRSYTSWFSFAASWLGFDRFQSTTLRSCLRKFIQPEILSGANQCTCERCNTKCDTYKQVIIHGNILIYYLFR